MSPPSRDEILSRLGDDLPVGIWIALAPGGELVYANERFAEILGMGARDDVAVGEYTQPYGIHRRDGSVYPEDQLPFVRAVREGATVVIDDLVIHRTDGRRVNVRAHAFPARDAEGTITHVVIAFFDITTEVRAEEERAESLRQLARAQRLESIGNLASGIAHDFNNLLAAVKVLASSIRRTQLTSQQETAIGQIEDLAESAATLTRSLLGFGGRGRTAGARVLIDDVVGQVGTLCARTFDRRIQVDVELGAPGVWVIGEFARLEQVVMNLAVNARDAMSGGGRLVLRTTVQEDEGILEVRDTGTGIDPAIRERIFEPYFTTKTSHEQRGTGLGLTTVQGIVESHGGSIEIDDALPRGTIVRVRLPRVVDTSLPASRPRAARTPVPPVAATGEGTVLVVDDEPYVRSACADALRGIGYDVVVAEGGPEAIALVRERAPEISAVLLDLVMPRMDGRATFLALRELDPNVPILLATATASGTETDALLDLGVRELIAKPYDLPTLAAAIARHSRKS